MEFHTEHAFRMDFEFKFIKLHTGIMIGVLIFVGKTLQSYANECNSTKIKL